MNFNKKLSETSVRIGEVRFSYAHVFEPKSTNGGDPKYSVSILIPKSNAGAIKLIEEAVNAAKQLGKTSKWGGKIPGNCKTPLRDGDIERSDDEAYKNAYFINASSKTAPGVVKLNPTGNPKYITIDAAHSDELYSGCYGYVSVNFFAFNNSGNKGIAAGLNNILKVKDGDFLGGRATAESDFANVQIDANLPEDEDDLPF